jgi:hypothetical protein
MHIGGNAVGWLTGLFAGLLLAACAGGPPPSTPPSSPAASADTIVPQQPVQAALPPSPAPLPPASAPAPVRQAPVRPAPDPGQLVGLDRTALSTLLGPPALKRAEPPAEVWQYSDPGCVLHVFLYDDGAGRRYHVTHYDAVRRGARPLSQRDCFGRLLEKAAQG